MGELVRYAVRGDEDGEGYLATPTVGSGPAVVVVQEWWGLVPHIKEVVERFAHQGFVALAPDLYHGVESTEPDEAGELLLGRRMDEAADEIAGAAAYLAGRSDPSGRIGVVGFGIGGSLALWSATRSDRVVAVVGFYPLLPWAQTSPQWSSLAGKTSLVHCCAADGGSETPGVQQVRQAIERAGGKVTLHDYPGTGHGFFNDDRPEVYDGPAAATAWARTLEFLRSHLA